RYSSGTLPRRDRTGARESNILQTPAPFGAAYADPPPTTASPRRWLRRLVPSRRAAAHTTRIPPRSPASIQWPVLLGPLASPRTRMPTETGAVHSPATPILDVDEPKTPAPSVDLPRQRRFDFGRFPARQSHPYSHHAPQTRHAWGHSREPYRTRHRLSRS